jgi:hypothetical protein
MIGGTIQRIELAFDAVAAVLLGASTALILLQFDASNGYAAAGAAVVLAWTFYGLRSVEPESGRHLLPRFAAPDFRVEEPAELLLDDVLTEIGPDSRVVRLFDRAAMPESPGLDYPDASQALYDALTKLRHSVR